MPCNLFNADKVTALLDQVKTEIPQAARDIINRLPQWQPDSFVASFATLAGRLEWLGLKCARFFYATKDCVMCGCCVDNCPNHNISGVKRRVCLHCAVCMESCPHRDSPLLKRAYNSCANAVYVCATCISARAMP